MHILPQQRFKLWGSKSSQDCIVASPVLSSAAQQVPAGPLVCLVSPQTDPPLGQPAVPAWAWLSPACPITACSPFTHTVPLGRSGLIELHYLGSIKGHTMLCPWHTPHWGLHSGVLGLPSQLILIPTCQRQLVWVKRATQEKSSQPLLNEILSIKRRCKQWGLH